MMIVKLKKILVSGEKKYRVDSMKGINKREGIPFIELLVEEPVYCYMISSVELKIVQSSRKVIRLKIGETINQNFAEEKLFSLLHESSKSYKKARRRFKKLKKEWEGTVYMIV